MTELILATILTFCAESGQKHCDPTITIEKDSYFPTIWIDPKHPEGRLAHGVCDLYTGRIALRGSHITQISKYELKELIYHELGHCVLGLGHTDGPNIMNSGNPDALYWVRKDGSNWQALKRRFWKSVHADRH